MTIRCVESASPSRSFVRRCRSVLPAWKQQGWLPLMSADDDLAVVSDEPAEVAQEAPEVHAPYPVRLTAQTRHTPRASRTDERP